MLRRVISGLPISIALAALGGVSAAQAAPLTLVGWGLDTKNTEAFVAKAAATGFRVLIAWSSDAAVLRQAVDAGKRHHVQIFACISPMGGLGALWKKRYPAAPVPWQVLTEAEEAARKFISAGRNKYIIPYQFGGEPKMTNEVLETRIICFNNPEARELLKPLIDTIVSVPGLEGLAFDGFGYQNYRCCHCGHCKSLLAEYCRQHPGTPEAEAQDAFCLDVLVDYINHLADYARSRRQDIKTSIHIWPVFVPEPLYGNRLDVDFCGQTAAWYTLWPEEKIAGYSRTISGEAGKYHQRQQGVGMIGYYDKPGLFPVKDAARVDMEIRTMIANGCRRIQVCSSRDVINNDEVAAVFRKYFGPHAE